MKVLKILPVIMLFIFAGEMVLAQDSTLFNIKKQELNIGYFDAFQLNAVPSFGIGYKNRTAGGAFRIRVNFSAKTRTDEVDSVSTTKNSSLYIRPQIGYEIQKSFGRLLLYYGVDVSISYNKFEYRRENLMNSNDMSTSKSEDFSVGINPLIGLKVFINRTISVSTETFFYVSYSSGKRETINGSNKTTINNSGFSTCLSPLGIFSINFHF